MNSLILVFDKISIYLTAHPGSLECVQSLKRHFEVISSISPNALLSPSLLSHIPISRMPRVSMTIPPSR